ncbi:MAG: zinc ABC transporter substrate-binding protein [Alphaproteobacteria bacterium]|nr:zinc ABC transporter substrate-binding protein [Alphaproteobacteria bacterium]
MHTVIKSLLAFVLALHGAGAQAQVLFACEPEWAALARVLLPEAQIHVATSHTQDPHHIEARPALIAQLRAADMALCSGAGLEDGWLPVLQQRSGNPKVQVGQPGLFWATEGQSLIGAGASAGNPFTGDVHPQGNPHIHAHPQRLLAVAQTLARRMGQLWPEQALVIEERQRGFETRWQAHLKRWQSLSGALRDQAVVAQHTHFTYLWEWLGIKQVADLEPKPGLSPSPAHLQQLLRGLDQFHPKPLGLAVAMHQDPRAARWVLQQRPALKLWVWPATVSQTDEAGLVQWFDLLLRDLNEGRT